MRFPTSVRQGRGTQSSSPNGMQMWRDIAQAQIDEPVIAACIFSRPSNVLANKAASSFGLIGHLALKKSKEVRAGGLPPHFILAVTAQQVIALGRTMRAGRNLAGEPGPEVARWERSSLQVEWKRGSLGYSYDVTIKSPSEGETVECSVGLSPESEEFLRLLDDPAASA